MWWCKIQEYFNYFLAYMITSFGFGESKLPSVDVKLKPEAAEDPAAFSEKEETNSAPVIATAETQQQTLKDFQENICKFEFCKKEPKFEDADLEWNVTSNLPCLPGQVFSDCLRNDDCTRAIEEPQEDLSEKHETADSHCEKPRNYPMVTVNDPKTPENFPRKLLYEEIHLENLQEMPTLEPVKFGIIGIRSTPLGNVYILSSATAKAEHASVATAEAEHVSVVTTEAEHVSVATVEAEHVSESHTIEEPKSDEVEKIGNGEQAGETLSEPKPEEKVEQIEEAEENLVDEKLSETNCDKISDSYLEWLSAKQKKIINESYRKRVSLEELTGVLGHFVADRVEEIEEVTSYRNDQDSEELTGLLEHIVADRVKISDTLTAYRKDLDSEEMTGSMEHVVADRLEKQEPSRSGASEASDGEGKSSGVRKVCRNRYFRKRMSSRSRSRSRDFEN